MTIIMIILITQVSTSDPSFLPRVLELIVRGFEFIFGLNILVFHFFFILSISSPESKHYGLVLHLTIFVIVALTLKI